MIQETIDRSALLALASVYPSVNDALFELIDNPFDYRRGRRLDIRVAVDRKGGGTIVVSDAGGEGMDAEGLRDWIQWGVGHAHLSTDIGQYHVGGKLACVYLAESLEIITRRAHHQTVYRFSDLNWGSRTTPFAGEIETLDSSTIAWIDARLSALPLDVGFTRIQLSGLRSFRYEPGILTQRLGNVYRRLLLDGSCGIEVDGTAVEPLNLPESGSQAHQAQTVDIPRIKLDRGLFISGRVWVMDRDRLPTIRGTSVKAGIRSHFNGRLITEGEAFGHNLAGKGSLQRLIGEIHIDGVSPTTQKNDWNRSSEKWALVQGYMHKALQPIVNYLNQVGDTTPVTRTQRKLGQKVRRGLELALQALAMSTPMSDSQDSQAAQVGGRRPPSENSVPEKDAGQEPTQQTSVTERLPRTPPPPDAVGNLLRKHLSGIPRIDFADLGRGPRAAWSSSAKDTLYLNTVHPAYFEEESYVAETVMLHLLADDESQAGRSPRTVLEELDRVLWAWSSFRDEA